MNRTESFFDQIAPNWDKAEIHSDEERLALLERVGIKEGDRVIDIACGTGILTSLIHQITHETVFGVDLSNKMIEIAKEKYNGKNWAVFRHTDFFDIEEDKKYDIAIIYNSYPHFDDPVKLSGKLSSILMPNGKFAILHSLSREELDKHHSSIPEISRSLMPAEKEAEYFSSDFNILTAGETEHSYFIIGIKKQ